MRWSDECIIKDLALLVILQHNLKHRLNNEIFKILFTQQKSSKHEKFSTRMCPALYLNEIATDREKHCWQSRSILTEPAYTWLEIETTNSNSLETTLPQDFQKEVAFNPTRKHVQTTAMYNAIRATLKWNIFYAFSTLEYNNRSDTSPHEKSNWNFFPLF